jgi:SAM-dependent methyltransferase
MREEHWQLQLVRKSLKKREKLKLLERHLSTDPGSVNLDLGCAQGILSWFVRRKPGFWVSADQDQVNLVTSRALLRSGLIRVGPGPLPFSDGSLDTVVSLDYLEHLDDDRLCLREIHRILKPGGRLLMAVPRTGRPFLLHRLRPLLGMKLEFYGHKREGYRLGDLRGLIEETGLVFEGHKRFSGFMAEFIELMLNALYTRFFSSKAPQGLRDGHIRPATDEEFQSRRRAFRLYGLIYPIVRMFTLLDRLFFFQRGYGLMVFASKPGLGGNIG